MEGFGVTDLLSTFAGTFFFVFGSSFFGFEVLGLDSDQLLSSSSGTVSFGVGVLDRLARLFLI